MFFIILAYVSITRHTFALCAGVRQDSTSTSDVLPNSVLELTPSSPAGAFRLRAVDTDLYIAMDEKGEVYGEKDRLSRNTLFAEHAYKVNKPLFRYH